MSTFGRELQLASRLCKAVPRDQQGSADWYVAKQWALVAQGIFILRSECSQIYESIKVKLQRSKLNRQYAGISSRCNSLGGFVSVVNHPPVAEVECRDEPAHKAAPKHYSQNEQNVKTSKSLFELPLADFGHSARQP